MNVSKFPVWNGLFYGSERKIVQKLGNSEGYDLWVAVYDISKSSGSPIVQDFIKNASANFCVIIFRYKSSTDLDEEGFIREYFTQMNVMYTDSKDEIVAYLDERKISLNLFQYPGRVDFPMGT